IREREPMCKPRAVGALRRIGRRHQLVRSAAAQTTATAELLRLRHDAQTRGVHEARRSTEQDLSDLLREHAGAHRVPGAALGILRDGVETFAWYGVADTRTAVPVSAASCFGVGSLTKSMVATVVARLAAAGRLSLDDPVAAHVPELRGAGWAEHATVRDLLASRSGLPLRTALEFGFAADQDPDDDVLSRFATKVAAEAPTTVAWSYTNAGWCVLGRVVETVTGSVWEEA